MAHNVSHELASYESPLILASFSSNEVITSAAMANITLCSEHAIAGGFTGRPC